MAKSDSKVTRSIMAFALLAAATGCSTHFFDMTYAAPEIGLPSVETDVRVSVGSFADERGTDPDWLGAIRGGYGNPLKRLRTSRPTAEIVADVVERALAERGLFAPVGEGSFAIDGVIQKLDCSYYVNREAHAHILFRVTDRVTGRRVFEQLYQADQKEGGVGAGIFGSPDRLHVLAQRTTREAIDRALDDPDFRRAIGAPTD